MEYALLTKVAITTLVFLFASITSAEYYDSYPPITTPVQSPVHPPAQPPPKILRPFVVVGNVYCQFCKRAGNSDPSLTQIFPGAVVKFECKDDKDIPVMTDKTSVVGTFVFESPEVVTRDYETYYKNCAVYLVSSPHKTCNIPKNINGGITGAKLKHAGYGYLKGKYWIIFKVDDLFFSPKCD